MGAACCYCTGGQVVGTVSGTGTRRGPDTGPSTLVRTGQVVRQDDL